MTKKKGNVKKVIREAGPNISKKEMNRIVKAAGGNVQKAVNRIASVQQNAPSRAAAPVVASGAANMLIKQAQKAPATQQTSFGTSRLGQTLQGMVGAPAVTGPRNPQSGAPAYSIAAKPGSLVPGGMVIRPGGNIGEKKQPVAAAVNNTSFSPYAGMWPSTPQTPGSGPGPWAPGVNAGDSNTTNLGNLPGGPGQAGGGDGEPQPNPNQGLIDEIARLSGELETMGTNFTTMQDLYNQSQLSYENQIADLSNIFNSQLGQIQQDYANQVAFGIQRAQEEEAAARAFMINQARGFSPANLQIGATYGTPKLAGTQGFKYRPKPTTAQVATAFTAPTLAAAAMTPQQQLQPTVLNV